MGMQIGFIGLGSMGSAVARNLIAADHTLHVFNRNPAAAESLRDAGAYVAATPAQAARPAEVIFTMVADDDAVNAVTLGPAGLLAGLRPGALHVSMSTISVAAARDLTSRHRDADIGFVSAPVFGRPDAAAARKLFVMAAGSDKDLKVAVPLLEQVGQSVGIVGADPAQANLVKLIGNFMLSVVLETLGEACAVSGKAGIDPMHLIDLLTSAHFNSPPYSIYGRLIASQRFEPAGFSLPLGQKDNRLMLAAAEALGVPLPLASMVRDRFLAARTHGAGDGHDWSAIALCAFAEAGLDARR
jgi:3-hydroxyisobutyrate dehydrogenase-like beta-hydroxyacid dehydrogenase